MNCRLNLSNSLNGDCTIELLESNRVFLHNQISENVTLIEEAYYKGSVHFSECERQIDFVELFLNEKSIGYSSQITTNGQGKFAKLLFRDTIKDEEEAQLFLLKYDLLRLVVHVKFADGLVEYYSSDYLLCVSKNAENAENIEAIITQLIEFDDDKINDWMFSTRSTPNSNTSLFEGGWQRNSYKSLRSYIQMIKDIYRCYETNYSIFKSNAKHTIAKQDTLMSYQGINKITLNSLNWLFQNSEQLSEVAVDTAIKLNETNYLPYKVNTEISVKSFDVYENRVILCFLLTVYNNAQNIAGQLVQEITDEAKILSKLQKLEIDGFRAPIITVKRMHLSYSKSLLSNLQELVRKIATQYSIYRAMLNCAHVKLFNLPKKTKAFQEIQPYRQIFEQIMKWYKFGDFILKKENLIVNIKTLDKLFEYYCLYKLLVMLKNEGFYEVKGKPASLPYEYKPKGTLFENERDVANTYLLQRNNIQLTVYYQPVIHDDKFENDLSLFKTKRTDYPYYTPDFIIKVQKEQPNDISYAIMDSKYSTRRNIRKYYMNEEIIKYSCQLSSKEKSGNAIKMVWLLQGRMDDAPTIEKYHNTYLSNYYPSNVSYGIVSINTKTDALARFWNEIALSTGLS